MKKCCKCKIEKEKLYFGIDKYTIDGLSRRCKQCNCEREKEKRKNNPDKIRKYDRERYLKNINTRKLYLEKNKDSIREKNRLRNEKLALINPDRYKEKYWKNRDEILKKAREKYKKNPNKFNKRDLKYKVRCDLNNAIKKGIVVRPEKCEKCSKICKPHGHHFDYSKPLEVLWLCSSCHGKEHRKITS